MEKKGRVVARVSLLALLAWPLCRGGVALAALVPASVMAFAPQDSAQPKAGEPKPEPLAPASAAAELPGMPAPAATNNAPAEASQGQAGEDMAPEAIPLGLTVSGGVSLGSYEAGFLYYHLQMLQQLPDLVQVKGATGASAGSLNALLALLQACRGTAEPPHQSLFWRAWIPIGLDVLYKRNQVNRLGLFSRHWMREVADEIHNIWREGLPTSCDVAWGVAVTRLYPRNVSLAHNRLDVPRVEEKFTLRIQGQGPGVAPVVHNFFDPRSGIEQALLLEDSNGQVPFSELRDATFASCSFPLAFSPKALQYCISRPSSPNAQTPFCTAGEARIGPFIDGGVLDNSPLRLMARTMAAGLERDGKGRFQWQERASAEQTPASPTAYYMFVSPEATDYPRFDAGGSEPNPPSALALVKQVISTFIATARTKELYTLLEERPDLRDRIFLPRRHVPAAGGLMSAFFGFFERDLRVYDFYLGMYDARRAFDEDVRAHLVERFGPVAYQTTYPEDRDLAEPETASQWQPLLCLRSVLDGEPSLSSACDGEQMRNFRILLQTSLTRLYDHCARLDLHRLAPTTNAMCRDAGAGAAVPHVADVAWPMGFGWRRRAEEPELEYLLRLLAAHQFRFADLGLKRSQSNEALAIIRERLATASSHFASAQPLSERNLVQLGAEIAVDWAAYAPPRWLAYGLLSRSVELGANVGLATFRGHSLALRLDVPLWFDALFSWLTSNHDQISFGPGMGLEVFYSRPQARYMQWRAGARAGYMFSTRDGVHPAHCDSAAARRLGACSRPRLELALGLSVLEHLRLQLAGTWYLPPKSGTASIWAVGPGIGLQF